MASNHVPNNHIAPQGQNIYNDPNFDSLFPGAGVDQYGNQLSWPAHQPQARQTQGSPTSWQHNAFTQQQSPPYPSTNSLLPSSGNVYQASPTYQYGNQFGNHGAVNPYAHAASIDPSLMDQMNLRQQQQSPYNMPMRNSTPNGQSRTVTPQALQHSTPSLPNSQSSGSPYQIPKTTTEMFAQRATPSSYAVQPVQNPTYEMAWGKRVAGFVSLDTAVLGKGNQISTLNSLVSFGHQPLTLGANRTVLPQYNPRQSLNELKKTGTKDKKVLEKLAKKSPAKTLTKIPRPLSASSPSAIKRELSDSEEYSESSDDDSDYSSDEEDVSPLPTARPDEPEGATRYDVIKATWAPPRKTLAADKVRKSLNEIWEVFSTIQKRWRADSKAVLDAEKENKKGELPVLKSRVTSGRDLLHVALKSLLEFGHPDVLYQMGQIKGFLYLCYQFLANRVKDQDWNGKLSSAIFALLVRAAGTLTTELLEETKLAKALNLFKKNVSEQNKSFIDQILDGATAGSKKAKVSSPPKEELAGSPNVKRPAPQSITRTGPDASAAKKVKASEPIQGTKKPPTTTTAAKPSPAVASPAQKRPGEKVAAAPAKARGTQIVNKPSSFFSTLNAASKKPTPSAPVTGVAKPAAQAKTPAAPVKKSTTASKPGFSFAATMASIVAPKKEEEKAPKPKKELPPETPEEKAKRLRKESRRHLRVTFKPEASLVNIRYFTHDPDEELGHDENFVRDAGDLGGEGRMFKQHREMEDDEDEEDFETREWKVPSQVDFSRIDQDERKRNYERYGGGECKPTSPETEANQRRENATLMVFYSHPSDIPSSPREPLETASEAAAVSALDFGPPDATTLSRVPKSHAPAAAPDFSALFQIFGKHAAAPTSAPPAAPQNTYVPQAPPMAAAPDLAAIMSALQSAQPPAAVPAPPAAPPVDLAALLSSIGGGNAGAAPLPPPPTAGWPFSFAMPQQQQPPQPANPTPAYQPPQAQHSHQNGGTKRPYEDGNDDGYGSVKKRKDYKDGHVPHKVIACKFYKQGKCIKGDKCTFIHER